MRKFLLATMVLCTAKIVYVSGDEMPIITCGKCCENVLPSQDGWRLEANCRAMGSRKIKTCTWKQLGPAAENASNTVLQGGARDCLNGRLDDTEINASLKDLQVPIQHGKYVFQLVCTDQWNRTKEKRFTVFIGPLTPKVVGLEPRYNISIKRGEMKLNASCQAMRRCHVIPAYIFEEYWVHLSRPEDLKEMIVPSKDGVVKFPEIGEYKFQYKCKDNYGEISDNENSIVTIDVKPPYVIGFDVGTSTTCVSYVNKNRATEDIKLNGEEICMPSAIAFSQNGDLLIGKDSLDQPVPNPWSTIYEVKRLIGQNYHNIKDHGFIYRVRPITKSHKPMSMRAVIDIPCNGSKNKMIEPELATALIIKHAAEIVEKELGVPIDDFIVALPAKFDDGQRKAIIDAFLIAGLNPVEVVSEPSVALFSAISFVDDLLKTEDEIDGSKFRASVIIDLGGGTSDFSFVSKSKNMEYTVEATAGNSTLGGRDIDWLIAKNMTQIFLDREKDPAAKEALKSDGCQQNIRIESKKAKETLSEEEYYTFSVLCNVSNQGPKTFEFKIDRPDFEHLVSDKLTEMLEPIDTLLAAAQRTVNQVDSIVLIGGIVNIPKIRERIEKKFQHLKKDDIFIKDPVQVNTLD